MEYLQMALLLVQMICAVAAFLSRDLMVAVIMFAAFSFASALLFAMMGAVDVGFTEAIIGTATTLFYVTVLFGIERRTSV